MYVPPHLLSGARGGAGIPPSTLVREAPGTGGEDAAAAAAAATAGASTATAAGGAADGASAAGKWDPLTAAGMLLLLPSASAGTAAVLSVCREAMRSESAFRTFGPCYAGLGWGGGGGGF